MTASSSSFPAAMTSTSLRPGVPRGVTIQSPPVLAICLAAFATRESEISLLHVNYGQRTEAKELDCFHAIADHLGVRERLVVDISHLAAVGERFLIV